KSIGEGVDFCREAVGARRAFDVGFERRLAFERKTRDRAEARKIWCSDIKAPFQFGGAGAPLEPGRQGLRFDLQALNINEALDRTGAAHRKARLAPDRL